MIVGDLETQFLHIFCSLGRSFHGKLSYRNMKNHFSILRHFQGEFEFKKSIENSTFNSLEDNYSKNLSKMTFSNRKTTKLVNFPGYINTTRIFFFSTNKSLLLALKKSTQKDTAEKKKSKIKKSNLITA